MPFAGFDSFDACLLEMDKQGHDTESARRICGALQARAEKAAPGKYEHIDFKPPAGAREEAQRGLDWRREHSRGGTAVGVARARDLARGAEMSPDTIKRMVSYFARHEVDQKGAGWSPGDGFPSAGRIAWALWGGDAGRAWAEKVARQMEAADRAAVEKASPEYAEAMLAQAKENLPKWMVSQLHARALPRAGGKASAKRRAAAAQEPEIVTNPKQSAAEDAAKPDEIRAAEAIAEATADGISPLAAQVADQLAEDGAEKNVTPGDVHVPSTSGGAGVKIRRRGKIVEKLTAPEVAAHIPAQALIAFVTSSPSALEAARREPLVGPVGALFAKSYLAPLGLTRAQVAILPIIGTPLITPDGMMREPTMAEINTSRAPLRKALEAARPGVIIALGNAARLAIGNLPHVFLPHPGAVLKFGDRGEVARKLGKVRKALVDVATGTAPPVVHLLTDFPRSANVASEGTGLDAQTPTEGAARSTDSDATDRSIKIAKADIAKRIVFGVVLDPLTVDAQQDWTPPRDIEETAHRWMERSRVIGDEHAAKADAVPVESWIVPYPSDDDYRKAHAGEAHRSFAIKYGTETLHSGAWVLGTKVLDDATWERVAAGELDAYSIGGFGNRIPTSREQMPKVELVEVAG